MFMRKFERRVFIAMMVVAAAMTPLAGCDGEFGGAVMLRASAGALPAVHQSIPAEQRHFDAYRNYRAAFDAAANPVADDDEAASVGAACYWRGVITND
ncbi:MAG: hypothetical protein ACREX0_12760 [Noviherbaspirillum sp.]